MKKVILLIVLAFSLSINAQEKSNPSKTDEVLSKAVEKGIELAEKTGNFVIEQAPDLLKEFYMWHITENVLAVILCLSIFIFLFIAIRRLSKRGKEEDLDFSDPEHFFPIVFSWVGILIDFGFLLGSIYQLAFILVAPKLYLIEYFIK